MNSSLLGEQIAKFRKALGMTQEDLGRAVGISAQAVSRWECGGAPDVALLPGLAGGRGKDRHQGRGRPLAARTSQQEANGAALPPDLVQCQVLPAGWAEYAGDRVPGYLPAGP